MSGTVHRTFDVGGCRREIVARLTRFCCVMAIVFWSGAALAQIGGLTPVDAPVVLETAEATNLTCEGVTRDYVPDNVPGVSNPLSDLNIGLLGLLTITGQTTSGTLQFTMKAKQNYINYSFGVPVPSVKGASTLTNPGNMSNFQKLTFRTAGGTVLLNQVNEIILECYPGITSSVFPKLHYPYAMVPGLTYQKISIDLHSPSLVENNPTNRTVDQLLGQTRYLAWYYFGGPTIGNPTTSVAVDDMQLEGSVLPNAASDWGLYE